VSALWYPRMVSKEQPTDLEGQIRVQLIGQESEPFYSKAEYILHQESTA
jgi:hypothetical protein